MRKEKEHKKEFLKLLTKAFKDHSELRIGQLLSQTYEEYKDTFHVSDKEMCYALDKFLNELELDVQHVAPDAYIKQIEEDAKNIGSPTYLLDEDEEEDEY